MDAHNAQNWTARIVIGIAPKSRQNSGYLRAGSRPAPVTLGHFLADAAWRPADYGRRNRAGSAMHRTQNAQVWPSAAASSTADWVSCPITRKPCRRPPPMADRSQRQQDPPYQEPQVPDPDVPAQRRLVHASRRVDDAGENQSAKQHGHAAVHHQQRTGPSRTGHQPPARNDPPPRAHQRQREQALPYRTAWSGPCPQHREGSSSRALACGISFGAWW
jgi:hypothetical protein